MEVILLELIEKLGQIGDVVSVKPGFARNFLLPRKKALRATEDNKKRFEEQRAQIEANNLKRKQEAEKIAKKVDGLKIVVIRQASETGMLFGSWELGRDYGVTDYDGRRPDWGRHAIDFSTLPPEWIDLFRTGTDLELKWLTTLAGRTRTFRTKFRS